jgi:hypothetical protein
MASRYGFIRPEGLRAQRIGTGQHVHAVPAEKFRGHLNDRGSTLWRENAFGCRRRPLYEARFQAGGRIAVEKTRGFTGDAKCVPLVAGNHEKVTGSRGLDFVAD